MSPIPLSLLGVVFVVWLLGVTVVLAVLREDAERTSRSEDQRDPEPGPYR